MRKVILWIPLHFNPLGCQVHSRAEDLVYDVVAFQECHEQRRRVRPEFAGTCLYEINERRVIAHIRLTYCPAGWEAVAD
jgi:hypothetical protein